MHYDKVHSSRLGITTFQNLTACRRFNTSWFLSRAKLNAVQTLELLYSLVPFRTVEMENNKALTPTSQNDKHVRDRARLPLMILQAFQLFTGTGTPFKPSVKTDLATYSRCCLLVLSTCPFYLLSLSLSRCATEKKCILDCWWKCFFWGFIPYCFVCEPLCCNYSAVSDIFLIDHKSSSCIPSTLNCVWNVTNVVGELF